MGVETNGEAKCERKERKNTLLIEWKACADLNCEKTEGEIQDPGLGR